MKRILTSCLAALALASCVPPTPQGRIGRHPEQFAALSESDKALVSQGRITRGMSRDAVLLAWGAPDRSYEGNKDGKAIERWDYTGSQAVHTTGFYGGYGFGGYVPYGRYPGLGYAVGPEIAYVPYRLATVWFANNHVDAWERARE